MLAATDFLPQFFLRRSLLNIRDERSAVIETGGLSPTELQVTETELVPFHASYFAIHSCHSFIFVYCETN